jgi:hypothetical protein
MKSLRWIGIVLAVIGIGGFFTVADDLRHTGELMGVGTVLVLGLIALAVSSWMQIGNRGGNVPRK